MIDSVIILSGGMDSTVMLAHEIDSGRKVAALSFHYGSKHNDKELPLAAMSCKQFGIDHKQVALPFIDQLFSSSLLQSGTEIPDGTYDAENMQSTVVPFRNGILIAIAVGYAESIGASKVLLGSHSGDHHIYPDCRPAFNEAMNTAVLSGTDNAVQLEFPFARMDKREIGDLGRKLGIDFTTTWTCYKGGDIHCGTCSACVERKFALRKDKGLDPTIYHQ
ncbi:7-cyano-7-deazaguanine synthase QueC [Desulfosediminicola flagellatus]|uniref:7-cyano-7-deazaguanine synthase QueC n=1 Tax=Desulfosediminicola flagellatus TaxID=2569541 RepID=UPI0010AD2773|nr:7-cyano-7-deazaguanine synthase QueC [Desulfosediminicola flagellatus]